MYSRGRVNDSNTNSSMKPKLFRRLENHPREDNLIQKIISQDKLIKNCWELIPKWFYFFTNVINSYQLLVFTCTIFHFDQHSLQFHRGFNWIKFVFMWWHRFGEKRGNENWGEKLNFFSIFGPSGSKLNCSVEVSCQTIMHN